LNLLLALEIFSVVANIIFLLLLIRENIGCWLFGILGSLSGAYLFYVSNLNSETILYLFYAVVGGYGWFKWSRGSKKNSLPVTDIKVIRHIPTVLGGGVLAFTLGTFMGRWTDADYPYFDACTTIFSFIATFFETRKIFSGWYYWIILNLMSIGLYSIKGLTIYAGLAVIYTIMSVVGLRTWRKSMLRKEESI